MINKFRERLRELRIKKNLTQLELAKNLGFTNQNISDWESGKSKTTFNNIIVLANYFQVTIDYLLGNSDSSIIHYNVSVIKNKFALNLKSLRTEKEISQNMLAKKLGVQKHTIYDWENGKSETTFDNLIIIADYFQVTVDYLLGNSDY